MKLYYDADDNINDRNSVSVVHDDGSNNWLDMGGTGTADVTGSITSNTITSFRSKFSFGFPLGGLPIELISFDARLSEGSVQCNWSTASELNNDYFTLERSADGLLYKPVSRIKGAGNCTSLLHYSSVDNNPLTGNSYYRLKQTNYDGTSAYSDAVHIFNAGISQQYTIYPNPSNGGPIHIQKGGADMSDSKIVLQTIEGKEIPVKTRLSDDRKEISLTVDQFSSSDEVYFVTLINGADHVKEKILIQRK
jgi:hypothetical protein